MDNLNFGKANDNKATPEHTPAIGHTGIEFRPTKPISKSNPISESESIIGSFKEPTQPAEPETLNYTNYIRENETFETPEHKMNAQFIREMLAFWDTFYPKHPLEPVFTAICENRFQERMKKYGVLNFEKLQQDRGRISYEQQAINRFVTGDLIDGICLLILHTFLANGYAR